MHLSADTRSAKPFSKHSYEKGVVIVQCPGCKGRHLLADRLGWFGEDGSIEETLARHGKGSWTFPVLQYHYNCNVVKLHPESVGLGASRSSGGQTLPGRPNSSL